MIDPRTIGDCIDAAVESNPTGLAVIDQYRRLTFAQLSDDAARAVQVLLDAGVRRGTTVAASGANGIDLLIAFLAVMRLGARWVGINRALTDTEQGVLLSHSRARLLLSDRDESTVTDSLSGLSVVPLGPEGWWRDAIRSATPRRPKTKIDPLAGAAISYTSGTTGHPKGVVHSQHNLSLPGRYLMTTPDFDDTSVIGICLPLTTLNVIIVAALPALFAARPCVVLPKLEAGTIANWIGREGITNMSIPPPALYDLATREDIRISDLSTLRSPRTGGADLPQGIRDRYAARFGRQVVGTYGLTEAPAVVAVEERDLPHVAGSSGKVVPYVDVRIVGDDGRPMPKGEPGEICLASRSEGPWKGVWRPMLGYWRRPVASEAALCDGLVHTGDVGSLDADENLSVHDRKGNILNRGGANVYPTEIERIVQDVPGVAYCAVVGVPDPRLGERVAIAIECKSGATVTEQTVIEHCGAHLARYKIPEVVVFVDSLPRNSMGKIIRAAVCERVAASVVAGLAS